MITLNADDLKQASQSRRKNSTIEMPGWKCEYCNKSYKLETLFMRHTCTQKERTQELKRPEGLAAYTYYSDWMKISKYKAPSIETFATSRYYQAFMKFNIHVQRISLPNPQVFMKLMVEKEISPTLWSRDQCYGIYLEYLDKSSDPFEQIETSVHTIMKAAEIGDIEPKEVFKFLAPSEIIELIRRRQLSPWLLFCSVAFKEVLSSMDEHNNKTLLAVINMTYWSAKLKASPDIVESSKQIAKELGI